MTHQNALVELTANELRHRIGTREVSPVELLEACIARIEAVNPHVNAITATCYDRARAEAKLAEQDYVNTQDAYRAAAQSAQDIKVELDKMQKALDAAKAREARARKAYDAALDAVEQAWGRPPASR